MLQTEFMSRSQLHIEKVSILLYCTYVYVITFQPVSFASKGSTDFHITHRYVSSDGVDSVRSQTFVTAKQTWTFANLSCEIMGETKLESAIDPGPDSTSNFKC